MYSWEYTLYGMEKSMKIARVALTGIILSIVYIASEMWIHGHLLMGLYTQTASIWRPEVDMNHLAWMMIVGEVIFAVMFGVIYAAGYDAHKSGLGQGLRFGFMMALFLAPMTGLMWYVILPIPMILAVYWFLAGFAQMLLLGIVAGLVYRK